MSQPSVTPSLYSPGWTCPLISVNHSLCSTLRWISASSRPFFLCEQDATLDRNAWPEMKNRFSPTLVPLPIAMQSHEPFVNICIPMITTWRLDDAHGYFTYHLLSIATCAPICACPYHKHRKVRAKVGEQVVNHSSTNEGRSISATKSKKKRLNEWTLVAFPSSRLCSLSVLKWAVLLDDDRLLRMSSASVIPSRKQKRQ